MRRKELASAYIRTVQTLRQAIEHETNRQARARAVQKFRANINPIIDDYWSSSTVQSIANEFAAAPDARADGEKRVGVLFNAVNGLARAGKDAAAESPELSVHYLKCAHELGALWIESLSADTDV